MSRLKPQLGLLQGIALLATTMLGTGIFVVPTLTARQVGSTSLLAWGLLLLLSMPLAFTFAALGKRYPHAGGVPHLVGLALGKRCEQLIAFLFFAILPVGLPASLAIGSGFIEALTPLTSLQSLLIQLAMLAGIWLVGMAGAKASGQLQTMIALFIMALVGILWFKMAPQGVDLKVPHWQHPQGLIDALGLMFWCIIGIEAFAHMGEEFRRPTRDFPIAMVIGTVLTLVIYWAVSVLVLKDVQILGSRASAASLPYMAKIHISPLLGVFVTILGFLACFASTNVYLQGYARLLWSMADEGKLPRFFARLNKQQTPVIAITSVTVFCSIITLSSWVLHIQLEDLLLYTNGNFVIIYLFAMATGLFLLTGVARLVALLAFAVSLLFLWSLGSAVAYAGYLSLGFLGLQQLWFFIRPLVENGSPQNY